MSKTKELMLCKVNPIVAHPGKELRERLEAYRARRGVPFAEILRRALVMYLDDQEEPENGNRDSHDQGRRKANRA